MKVFVGRAGIVVAGLWLVISASFGRAEEPQTVPATSRPASAPSMCRCQGDSGPNFDHIQQVLSQPLMPSGLEFTGEPLVNIVNFLEHEYDIPIQIDVPALEDAGLTTEQQFTVNLQDISLRSALRHLLKKETLTYIVRDEVLIITTPEEAESELVTCVYDVRDLVALDKKGKKDFDSVIDAIACCVASESWAENGGGEAEIRPLEPGLLVISQTQAVHEEIRGLLSNIRETLREPIPGAITFSSSAPKPTTVEPTLATDPAVQMEPTLKTAAE